MPLGASAGKIGKLIAYQSFKLEAKELSKLEQDLLSFLLLATGEDRAMIGKLISKIVDTVAAHNREWQRKKNLDFEIRTQELEQALYQCGIPLWIARRNAKAFMVLRPSFDLRSPKWSRLKNLLEFHQDEFLNAYYDVAAASGQKAADKWMEYIRKNDIFFARICQLPDDYAVKYLFA